MDPFWQSNTMRGESLLFIQEAGELPTARLLFSPLELQSVKSASGEITYVEGRDYVLNRAAKTLSLPVGSRIPFVTDAELRPPNGSPHTMANAQDAQHGFLYSEGHFFHDLQVEPTYTHEGHEWKNWQGYVPAFAGPLLPVTMGKLRRKEELRIVMLGDSISAGYNSSEFTKTAPFMPPYPELLRRELEAVSGARVRVTNLSKSGQITTWGLQQSGAVIKAKPDLVILAFGMNDSARVKPELYLANVKEQISLVKAALPDAEWILVASSLPNPAWQSQRAGALHRFEVDLQALSGPGIAFADLTAVWAELLKHKNYLDITGNGVNHPNDFGHRVYAQFVLALLTEKPDVAPAN